MIKIDERKLYRKVIQHSAKKYLAEIALDDFEAWRNEQLKTRARYEEYVKSRGSRKSKLRYSLPGTRVLLSLREVAKLV